MGARTVSKALFLFAPAVLGLVLFLPGCTGCEERTDSGYPDRSYENFRRLDREVIKLGMTEEEVVKVLGPPDRRTGPNGLDIDLTTPADSVSLWYRVTTPEDFPEPGKVAAPIEYILDVIDGKVVHTGFESGF